MRSFTPSPRNQRGIVLVVVLLLMGFLSALAGAYSAMIRADTVVRGAAARERRGFYAAEAGLNVASQRVQNFFNAGTVPNSFTDSLTIGTGAQQRNVTFGVAPVPNWSPGRPQPLPVGDILAGLNAIPYRYGVFSQARNTAGDLEATLGSQFQVNSVPIFQFMAFYANDLEIAPGPTMNASGRIHTNRNLYLNSGNQFNVADAPTNPFVQVSAGRNIFRGTLRTFNECTDTVNIDMNLDSDANGSLDPRALLCTGGSGAGGTGNPVSAATIAGYLGTVADRVPVINTPAVSTVNAPFSGGAGLFWNSADLRIVLDTTVRSTASICGGPNYPNPGLFPVQVLNADGSVDIIRTPRLQAFMCQRRGAIFYNDIPNPVAQNFPQNSNTGVALNDANAADSYTPCFGATAATPCGQPGSRGTRKWIVYRRVGEDTNGDGVINTRDRNDDICAVGAGVQPWWNPPFCPWPNNTPASTSWFVDADYRRGGFYSARENAWMLMLNVNIRALIEWNQMNPALRLFDPADRSDDGLVIFLSVQAADSAGIPAGNRRYGVRVFDSADLDTRDATFPQFNPATDDPTGLTVVTDQAMYVQGNYNYYPNQTAGQKYPAALVGDSLNVLSQGWEVPWVNGTMDDLRNDRKSPTVDANGRRDVPTMDGWDQAGSNCGRPASAANCQNFTNGGNATAPGLGINAAFIANVDTTVPGGGAVGYNGGLENYPRFHEMWRNARTLNYLGSFVSLGTTQRANGTWNTQGPFYAPPARNWNYDAAFNNPRLLPPLTPRVNFIQQNRYTRFYD